MSFVIYEQASLHIFRTIHYCRLLGRIDEAAWMEIALELLTSIEKSKQLYGLHVDEG